MIYTPIDKKISIFRKFYNINRVKYNINNSD